MKVILIKDVKGMGRAHTEIETSDGHALNFLIPRRLAIAATLTARKEAELRRKQSVDRGEVAEKLIEERLAALAEETIVIRKKANEQGHLYDAVGAKEIAEAAALPEEAIRLEKHLKELGTFEIPVAYGADFGAIKIAIEAA